MKSFSEKVTKKQEAEMKMERDLQRKKAKVMAQRLAFILLFSGNIAITIYLAILVSKPDTGQYILSGLSGLSAFYFLTQAIK